MGTRHGNVIHLGDRDCSMQRRHQKLIEEAPAASIPVEVRSALHGGGRAVSALEYDGAGTVEFL